MIFYFYDITNTEGGIRRRHTRATGLIPRVIERLYDNIRLVPMA
jgi:hypothetical protein